MDSYTKTTETWLDQRFNAKDKRGIYHAHEPIYGFRKGHSEVDVIGKYINTYQIMKALAHIEFNSLLDVGAAEGYKAALTRELFGVEVKSSDLSKAACKRAKEIFSIDAVPADIHNLPFENGEFDIVLCSETLEHVTDVSGAFNELLRVARKAVVITVPHEPKHKVDKNIEENALHSHINRFDVSSFEFLESIGYSVNAKKILNPLFKIPRFLLAATPFQEGEIKFPKDLTNLYTSTTSVLAKTPFGTETTLLLMQLDHHICRLSYEDILFVILKDSKCWLKKPKDISAIDIMSFSVPYHYLKN